MKNTDDIPTVVMRSHNDRPLIEGTLQALAQQDHPFRLLVMDNASTDGTRELVNDAADEVVEVAAGTYIPGRVLNRAMAHCTADRVVFLNADCTPTDRAWLSTLLAALSPAVGAVFGRQVARPDCFALYRKDTEEAYGDGGRHHRFRNAFSMANCAIRRSLWEQHPFREDLNYSEDIDWSFRVRSQGATVRYARDAAVIHSHNYSLAQLATRHRGEGRAEADIFAWSFYQRSSLRYTVLPLARQITSDIHYCYKGREPVAALASPVVRIVQAVARRQGFLSGLKERPQ